MWQRASASGAVVAGAGSSNAGDVAGVAQTVTRVLIWGGRAVAP